MGLYYALIGSDEIKKYSSVPEYFMQLRPDLCIFFACFESRERKELLATTPAVRISKAGNVVEMRPPWIYGKIGREILEGSLAQSKKTGTHIFGGNVRIWTTEIEGKPVDDFVNIIVDGMNLEPMQTDFVYGGWNVEDIFDSRFIGRQIHGSSLDDRLIRCAGYPGFKSWYYIRKLSGGEPVSIPFIESPYSRFYMEDGKILGAMTAGLVNRRTILIDGVYLQKGIPDPMGVFDVLCGGVLEAALEGHGLSSQLICRFDDPSYLKALERLIGPSMLDVRQQLYN